jgi:hypothetical protein
VYTPRDFELIGRTDMRKLMGVMYFDHRALDLKRQSLFFDMFELWYDGDKPAIPGISQQQEAELDFLRSRKIIIENQNYWTDYLAGPVLHLADENFKRLVDANARLGHLVYDAAEAEIMKRDGLTRALAGDTSPYRVIDSVPICERSLPFETAGASGSSLTPEVLNVALNALPIPDDTCAWEDIIAFKSEMHDKEWSFRRFLSTLSSKKQTEAEIQDDIEWTVNEYRKAMEIHRLKSSNGFVEVFLISPLEIIEDLVKFRWSKLAKGLLSVNRRRVELLEAEMKAPGRECAYVFDARKRFGC